MAEIDIDAGILVEIRASEKKADELLEKARHEKDAIIHEASASVSSFISRRDEEIKLAYEKKISESKEKSKLIREEKISEGMTLIKSVKTKSEKSLPKAVEFVLKRFEELVYA